MNRLEHLLTILAEEAAEVTQAATKALRFGLEEVFPETGKSNLHRLIVEKLELTAVTEMLMAELLLLGISADDHLPIESVRHIIAAKKERVEKYLEYSKQCGTLQENSSNE
jgi:homoserine acetyltransferase